MHSLTPPRALRPSAPRVSQRPLLHALALGILSLALGACAEQEQQPKGGGRIDDLPEEQRSGYWVKARAAVPLSPEQEEDALALAATGYAGGVTEAPEIVKVTRYDRERASTGLSFVVSGHGPEAFLIDMEGDVQHRWNYEYKNLWPDLRVSKSASGKGKWRRAHLYPNGDILAIHEGIGMIRLDKDSNLIWKYAGGTHHDMHVTPDGHIWTLAREVKIHPFYSEDEVSMNDVVLELDADGNELQRVSILECLQKIDSHLLDRLPYPDMFHANSIEVLDGSIAHKDPAFAEGNVLISLRHVHAAIVINMEQRKVVWSLRRDFRWQHDAQITEAGTLLLFDNFRGPETPKISKIREYDPSTWEQIWIFEGNAEEPFFSRTCGTTQRLSNGNTLIAESDGGRAFEITSEGEVVWEYYNPHRAGPNNEYIGSLFAVHRVGEREDFDWLAAPESVDEED